MMGALVAFAANSLLCRAALGPGTIDAGAFTALRLDAPAEAESRLRELLARLLP